MKINRLLYSLLCFLFIITGCKKGEVNAQTKKSHTQKKTEQHIQNETATVNEDNNGRSFVLSCGSGCAMTYNTKNITGNLPEMKVTFSVDMYVDEKLSDTYNETYIFSYDSSNQIKNIHLEGKNENVLETLMPDAQRSFREFAEGLVRNNSGNQSALPSGKSIYNKKSNPETASYKTIQTTSVKGLDKYSCSEPKTRYIPVAEKGDTKLLLVPQDCGDFPYRYYLIAVKNNTVTGNLYVEGEWYEPDGEDDKEVRSFTVDSNYNIAVKIQTPESSQTENYSISDKGSFVKK